MKNWENLEQKVNNFLNENFNSNTGLIFKPIGGADSTNSDIMVLSSDHELLYFIEVKLSPAQSGQFVIYNNESTNKFELSPKNKNINPHSKNIIDFLNSNKSYFENKKQTYFNINCNKETIYNWIIEHYKSKSCRIIATSTNKNNFIAFVHIDNFKENFDVSACMRKKRSGTSHVSKKDTDFVVELLKVHFENIKITDYKIEFSKRIKVFIKDKLLKNNEKYFGGDYFLSENEDHFYLKKQSTINNMNIIFSVKYIGPKTQTDFNELIKILT